MIIDLIEIALLCVLMGIASIPLSFAVNSSPVVVWFGNALGSLLSALVVIYIINHLNSGKFKVTIQKTQIGKKVTQTLDKGKDNQNVRKTEKFINKYGLKAFSLFCPLFPGVLISTVAVYLLDLDKKLYIRWMCAGVIFISGIYVFGYWWVFVK